MAITEDMLPKGYHKTALQIVKETNADLKGKNVIVTGASSGIGVETLRAFASAGAVVYAPVRNREKAAPIFEEIATSTGNSNIVTMDVDLASLQSVRAFAEAILALNVPIHYLILNAGVMALPERTLTVDGFEMQFAVNLLANFLMSKLLLPALRKAGTARMVVVSSCAHLKSDVLFDDIQCENYNKGTAYANAKTAAILFAKHFNRLYSGEGITGYSVHPGGIMTGLQVHMSLEEKIKMGWIDEKGNINPLFKNVEQGAATTVYAALEPSLSGGEYLEDCGLSQPNQNPAVMMGHAPYIHNEDNQKRLWTVAEELLSTCKL